MSENCPMCGGAKQTRTTTFTVDYSHGVLVVRNVLATICSQCGVERIADADATRLEHFSTVARKEKKQFEVVDFANLTSVCYSTSETQNQWRRM